MPLISDLGKVGVIKDVLPHRLPPNAFSDGRNVRFFENSVEKFLGHSNAFSGELESPIVQPYWLTSIRQDTDMYVVYAGENKVYATDGATHYDMTRTTGDYSMNTSKGWTGGVMGGIVFLNNGVDAPQSWVGPASLTTKLTDLPNWPSGALCQSMRSFKQFMIAMDYTNGSGTSYPRLVKWSTGASFNAVPTSWDETDATLDAGEYELADTSGRVIDGAELRDTFVIYKEDSIWGMQFVGPPFVFRFYKISETTGALSRRCMVEINNGHFVFGVNDCYINDGQNLTSILNQRMRREVFNNLNTTNFERCFVVPYFQKSEVWACYPDRTADFANRALVWNWTDNSIGIRDLPDIAFAHAGAVPTIMGGGDSSSWVGGGTWDDQIGAWDSTLTYDITETKLMMASPGSTGGSGQIYLADSSNKEDTENMTSNVIRESLFFDSIDTVKFCRGVRLNMDGGPVNVYVGRQMSPNESTTWEGPFSFDPSTDYKINCRVTGRLLGIKVESTADVAWRLNSYDMDVVPAGRN